jgi:transposase
MSSLEHFSRSEVRVIEPAKGLRLVDPLELWRWRELFVALVVRDIAVRYKQTAIGIAWVVVQPLATVAVCTGVYRLSRRTTVGLLQDLFGVELALGSVTACEQATSQALAAPVAEAQAYVQQQAVIHVDETGWREARRRAWLWVAVTAAVTVFLVHARRGAGAAQVLLGAFAGILVTDRWGAYTRWPVRRRQLCWAHLRRHFLALSECSGQAGRIGQALLAERRQLFGACQRL